MTECGVTTVAMESTGVYWIPLFELLESRGFEVYLVEPGQLSRCGARPKTDVLDVQWIQRLHTYGLLRPSFRPFHHQQIAECDQMVEAELAKLANRAGDKRFEPKPRKGGRKPNTLTFEACGPLFKALGVDLTEIEGIDVATALVILAELGVDVSRFPTEKHFASWLGVCPRQYESNKSKKKRGPRKGKNRIAIALRMAAQGLGKTKSPLAMYYRRIKSRIGGKGAITATAHKLACLVYRMLRYGKEYVKQSMEAYERKVKEQVERALRRKAAALGYELLAKPAPEPARA